MKKLYIARHAKSDWSDSDLNDFDRPLNNRGKKDLEIFIPKIAKRIEHLDLIHSSDAKRTLKTAQAWARAVGIRKDDILINNNLYLASLDEIMDCIRSTSNSLESIMIVGHNPGLTQLVSWCGYEIDNLPTSGIVCFEYQDTDWEYLDKNLLEFLRIDYPKNQ